MIGEESPSTGLIDRQILPLGEADLGIIAPGGIVGIFSEGVDIEFDSETSAVRVFSSGSTEESDPLFFLDQSQMILTGIDLSLDGGALLVDGNPIFDTMSFLSFGEGSTAVNSSVAFGDNSTASGAVSFSGGPNSTAAGSVSFAFGDSAQATGSGAIAFGSNADSGGTSSIAIGEETVATADRSVAIGTGTSTSAPDQLVLGTYNLDDTEAIVIIGDGLEGQPSNALVVTQDGDVEMSNKLKVSGELAVDGPVILNGEVTFGEGGGIQIDHVPPRGGIFYGRLYRRVGNTQRRDTALLTFFSGMNEDFFYRSL